MQLRLKNPTEYFELILPWDPAIDTKASKIDQYLDTLDRSHLTFVAGKSPTIVHVLPASKWLVSNVIQGGGTNAKMQMDLARHSIQKITNLDNHILDSEMVENLSSPIPVWTPSNKLDPTVTTLGREILYSTEKEMLIFNLKTIQFVATVVQANAFLVPGTKQPYQALRLFYQA